MADLRRIIKCANCGVESTVYISSELDMHELVVAGKCRCGSSLQVTYKVVDSSSSSSSLSSTSSSSSSSSPAVSESGIFNIDESLFGSSSEAPSDNLKNIMED